MPAPATSQRTWTPAKLKLIKPNAGGAENVLWELDFPFNPKDFSLTRGAKWEAASNSGGTMPPEYKGPDPATLTVEIFLDETTEESGDISRTVKKLLGFVNPEADSKSQNKPSAPHARFIWGTAIEFKGYIQQVAIKYTLFRENGNPVRGSATLTIKEFGAPEGRQNPTSGGDPGARAHRVVAGDTLQSIAYAEYGNAAGWRRIADANSSIDDPMRLVPGRALVVPPQ